MDIKYFTLMILLCVAEVLSNSTSHMDNKTASSNDNHMSITNTLNAEEFLPTSVRTKREPPVYRKARPIRLKKIPTVVRKRRPQPPPPPKPKYGPPSKGHQHHRSPPPAKVQKPRYGPPQKNLGKGYGKPLNNYNPSNELTVSFEVPKQTFDLSKFNLNAHNLDYLEALPSTIEQKKKTKKTKTRTTTTVTDSNANFGFPVHFAQGSFSADDEIALKPNRGTSTPQFSSFDITDVKPFGSIPSTSYGVPNGNTYNPNPVVQNNYGGGGGGNGFESSYLPPKQQSFGEPPATFNTYSTLPDSATGYNYPVPKQQQPQPTPKRAPPTNAYLPPSNAYLPSLQTNRFGAESSSNTPAPPQPARNTNKFTESTYLQSDPDFRILPTHKFNFELEQNSNGGLYETAISSYDVPVHFDLYKNTGNTKAPLYYESTDFSQDTTKVVPQRKATRNYAIAPTLPNTYDQEQFSVFLKNKQNRLRGESDRVRQVEAPDLSHFFDEQLFDTQSANQNLRSNRKQQNNAAATPITNLNVYSAENYPSASDEYYEDFPTTTITPTTRKRKYRRRKIQQPVLPQNIAHILDTDDLRDAYGSSSQVRTSIVRPDTIIKSKYSNNRLPPTDKSNTNFVLLSSANKKQPQTTEPNYQSDINLLQDYDIISIEKSKSHSYYGGTMSPALAANFATKRVYDTKPSNSYTETAPTKTKSIIDGGGGKNEMNVVSSGFYVTDISDGDSELNESEHNVDDNDGEEEIDDEYGDDFENTNRRMMGIVENVPRDTWNGGNLPKNHKFTESDATKVSMG